MPGGNRDARVHYKLYKAGKHWVTAMIVTTGLVWGMNLNHNFVSANNNSVDSSIARTSADDLSEPSEVEETTAAKTVSAPQATTEQASADIQATAKIQQPTEEQLPEAAAQTGGQSTEDVSTSDQVSAGNQDNLAANPSSSTKSTSDQTTSNPATTPRVSSNQTDADAKSHQPGDIVTPTQVKKAPDPVDKSSNPTVEPQIKTDVPKTNTYAGTVFAQIPIYLNGQLANVPGKDANINGMPVSNQIGQIGEPSLIKPQHENEIMKGGYYDGHSGWMAGFSTDNKIMYLYQVDKQGNIVQTQSIAGPQSDSYDPGWQYTQEGTTFSWQYGALEIQTNSGAQNIRPLTYIKDIPVKYLDNNGNALAPATTVSGYSDTYVDVPYPTIDGYRLIRVPYQNDAHHFLINNVTVTSPSTDWVMEHDTAFVDKYYKILDDQNTQLVYLVIHYPAQYGGGSETSSQSIVKADPHGFLGYGFARAWVTASMPQPVGNPLIFTYEPIESYTLQINYLNELGHTVLAPAYQADGAGTYEIVSPVIYDYETASTTVSGVLNKDMVVNVYYKLKQPVPMIPVIPINPDKPVTPIQPVTPDRPTNPVQPSTPTPTTPVTPSSSVTSETPTVEQAPGQIVTPDSKTPEAVGTCSKASQTGSTVESGQKQPTQSTPQTVTTSSNFSKASQPSTSKKHQNIQPKQTVNNKQLPQTGDYESNELAIIGSLLLAILALFGGLLWKKKKN